MNGITASYPMIWLPGTGTQSVSGADRTMCAAVAALASGAPRCILYSDVVKTLRTYIVRDCEVPDARLDLWLRSLGGGMTKVRYERQPAGIPYPLDDYQLSVLSELREAGGVIGFACGLGKTLLASVWAIAHAPLTLKNRLLITCPLNAFSTWNRIKPSLARHFEEVSIVSMDSLHNLRGMDAQYGGVLIIDEAHAFGDMKTRRTKAAHALRAKFDYALCLSGTILHGGIQKAHSLLDLACPGAAGFSSTWKMGEYFRCIIEKQLGTRVVKALAKPSGASKDRFNTYLLPWVKSVNYSSPAVKLAFDMPEHEVRTVVLGAPWASMDEAAANLIERFIAEHPDDPLPTAAAIAHMLAREGTEEKIESLFDNLTHDSDLPLVIFAHYIETLDAVERALVDRELPYVRVDGDVTGPERIEAERRFQEGEVDVFLGQMAAASVSMNLQRANLSVALDHSWRAVDYDQALHRTYRRGQTRHTIHLDFIANAFQELVVSRVRQAVDFDASVAEWQQIKSLLTSNP